ncbi:MAG: hypothetical protein WCI26_09745 [Acidimicrobiales bacterium]
MGEFEYEYGFDIGTDKKGTGFGVGLEWVTMTHNNQVTSWGDSLAAFKTAAINDAAKSGMPVPSSYTVITG